MSDQPARAAKIQFHSHPTEGFPAMQLIIDGHDVSHETFPDVELVKVGTDPATQEYGLRVTFAIADLTVRGAKVDPAASFDDAAAVVADLVTSSQGAWSA